MKYIEKLDLLATWQAEIELSDAGFKPLEEALGGLGESRPELAMYGLQQAYTRAVAAMLGDESDTLAWYWLENDFGRKARHAGPVGATRAITTAEDLLWLLEVVA